MMVWNTVDIILLFTLCCLGKGKLLTLSESSKQFATDYHNQLRSNVAAGVGPSATNQPKASNMKKVSWNEDIAKFAETWAESLASKGCQLQHSTNAQRSNIGGYKVGENLAYRGVVPLTTDANLQSALKLGIDAWFGEYKDYTFGPISSANFQAGAPQIGHYTQIVWADSDQLGCGLAECNPGVFLLACNYGPGGNFIGRSPYKLGPACSSCPSDVSKCDASLCSSDAANVPVAVVPVAPAPLVIPAPAPVAPAPVAPAPAPVAPAPSNHNACPSGSVPEPSSSSGSKTCVVSNSPYALSSCSSGFQCTSPGICCSIETSSNAVVPGPSTNTNSVATSETGLCPGNIAPTAQTCVKPTSPYAIGIGCTGETFCATEMGICCPKVYCPNAREAILYPSTNFYYRNLPIGCTNDNGCTALGGTCESSIYPGYLGKLCCQSAQLNLT